MSTGERSIQQYLSRHAEPEASQVEAMPGSFRRVLVLPVYREAPACLQQLFNAIAMTPDTLVIVVANRPHNDARRDWFTPWLHLSIDAPSWSEGTMRLWQLANYSLLLVDRVRDGEPLPAEEGVGRARKIGADIACQLIASGKVSSPWIANTDADAILPRDYFAALDGAPDGAAVVYPYRHVFDDSSVRLATLIYEFSLHHYVEGLRWAGSPYAYHTLGSTQAVHYRHYAAVRGFPRRAAAEDFYLLNKLAKTGPIHSLQQPDIKLRARYSDRVPFGTGPAVNRIAHSGQILQQPLYHPVGFAYLRIFLDMLQRLAREPTAPPDTTAFARCIKARGEKLDAQQLLRWSETIDWQPILQHLSRQCRTEAQRLHHLQYWFDGFRTLKLVNYLRREVTPPIPFSAWEQQADRWRQSGNHRMQLLSEEIRTLTCPGGAAGE